MNRKDHLLLVLKDCVQIKRSKLLFSYKWHFSHLKLHFPIVLYGKRSDGTGCAYLSIIGRGRAKYHNLSVASRSIICRCRRQRQIIDLRATDKSSYFARSRPIIVLLFTYKASLYLSLKLTSFIHKFYFLKNYLITSSSLISLACKYCRKTLTAVFIVAFLYSLSFFPIVNKTTRLLTVQKNEPPLFTKSGGNAHAQTIICR